MATINETQKQHKPYLKKLIVRTWLEYERAGLVLAEAGRVWDVAPAHFYNVIFMGMDSPTLRRKFGIPKEPPRVRLRIDCTPELRAEFHQRRGDMTGGEYLTELLRGHAAKEST